MANLLADGSNWRNGDDGSLPSSVWNGKTFSASFSNAFEHILMESYEGTVAPGDIFTGSFVFNSLSPPDQILLIQGTEGDANSNVAQIMATPGVPANFSFNASLGNTLKVAPPETGSNVPHSFYGLSYTITPLASACDELGRVTKAYVSGYF